MLHKPYGILFNYNERGRSGRSRKSGGAKKIKSGKVIYYVTSFESFNTDKVDFNTMRGSMCLMLPTGKIKKLTKESKLITLFKKRFYPQPGVLYG
jgi:hypothetical protein